MIFVPGQIIMLSDCFIYSYVSQIYKEQPAREDIVLYILTFVSDFVINIIKLQYNKIRHAAHQ